MEYLQYDYQSTKNSLKDYEKFISNGYFYKHYLFDLSLITYDNTLPKDYKDNATKIINFQKLIFISPYPIVLLSFVYLYRKNYFSSIIYDREFKITFNFFMLVLMTRMFQKGLLKYQSEDLLKEVKKLKN